MRVIAGVFALLALLHLAAAQCDGTLGDNYYVGVSSSRTHSEATSLAAASVLPDGRRGHLATLTTLAEYQLAGQIAGRCGRMWVAQSDAAVEGQWRFTAGPEAGDLFWLGGTGGSARNGYQVYWNGGEPNNVGSGGEDCAEIRSQSNLNDLPCNTRIYYLVEYELNSIQFDGHVYVMEYTALTWAAANTAARSKTFNGLIGHLATINSQAEADALQDMLDQDKVWLGAAYDTDTFQWSWRDAEGAVIPFWTNGNGGPSESVNGGIDNWASGQPSTSGNCMASLDQGSGAAWYARDCLSTVDAYLVEYEVVPFTYCPPDFQLTTLTGTATVPAEEAYYPSVTQVLIVKGATLTSSHESNFAFPTGTTHVIHSLAVNGVDDPYLCEFDVHVFFGVSSVAGGVHASALPRMDLLVDGSGKYPNVVGPPVFTADLSAHDYTFFLKPPRLQQFNVAINDSPTNFVVLLQWCEFGDFPPTDDPSLVVVGLESQFYGLTDATVALTDAGSVITNDLRCVRVHAVSSTLNEGILSFTGLRITLRTTDAFPDRRRRAVGETTFFPDDQSIVAINYTATDNSSNSFIEDSTPPSFIGCPTSFTVTAPNGETFAPSVSWNEPIADDNNRVASVVQTHTPPVDLPIIGSPHTVTYTAKDEGGLEAKCTFTITVDFSKERVQLDQVIEENGINTLTVNAPAGFSGATVYDYVLGEDYGASSVNPITVNVSAYNTLTLNYSAPFGKSFVVEPSLPGPQLVLDLLWEVDPSDPTQLGPSGLSVQLDGVTNLDSTPHSAGSLLTVKLHSSSSIVTGTYARLQAVSKPLQLGSFAARSFLVTASYPAGATGFVSNLTSSSTSSLGLSYFFSNAASIEPLRPTSIYIKDIIPPVISGCPNNTVVTLAEDASTFLVDWKVPNATDNLVNITFAPSHVPPEAFAVTDPTGQPHQVSYVATDLAGNVAVCNFSVTVLDATAPVVSCPGNKEVLVHPNASQGYVFGNLSDPLSIDENSLRYEIVSPDDEMLDVGVHERRTLVTDLYGLQANCTINVTVIDLTIPEFSNCPSDISLSSSAQALAAQWIEPTAADNVAVGAVNKSHEPGSLFSLGTTTVTYTATDSSGNQGSCVFSVAVVVPEAAKDTRTPILAGTSTAVALLVILAIFGAVIHRRREIAKRNAPYDFDEICAMLAAKMSNTDGVKQPREIRRTAVKILDVLGSGNFGQVAKAVLEENYGPFASNTSALVAAKMLFDDSDEQDKRELVQEAAFMAQLQHRNVVNLVGVVTQGHPPILVMEYCEFGALNHYLTKHGAELSEDTRYKFAFNVADGLAYLNSRSIVHRDIAARNVLVNSEQVCKISDFGLSRDTSELESAYYQAGIKGQLPVRWCAPEALEERKFSASSDVWGYGVLLYEIWTDGATPYRGWTNQKVWVEVVHGYRLPCPDNCPGHVHGMMLRCWEEERNERISAEELKLYFSEYIPGSEVPWLLQDHGINSSSDVYGNSMVGSAMDDMPVYDAGEADEELPRVGVRNVSYKGKEAFAAFVPTIIQEEPDDMEDTELLSSSPNAKEGGYMALSEKPYVKGRLDSGSGSGSGARVAETSFEPSNQAAFGFGDLLAADSSGIHEDDDEDEDEEPRAKPPPPKAKEGGYVSFADRPAASN